MVNVSLNSSSISGLRFGLKNPVEESSSCFYFELFSQGIKLGSLLNVSPFAKLGFYALGLISGIVQNKECKPKTSYYSFSEAALDISRFSFSLSSLVLASRYQRIVYFAVQPIFSLIQQYQRDSLYERSAYNAKFEKAVSQQNFTKFQEALGQIEPNSYFGSYSYFNKKPVYTPLGLVARKGNDQQAKVLVAAGANPSQRLGIKKFSITPIQLAAKIGNTKVFSFFCRKFPKTTQDEAPLGKTLSEYVFSIPVAHHAIYNELVKAKPTTPGHVFHQAVNYKLGLSPKKSIKVVQALMQNKIGNPQDKDHSNFTPLHTLVSMRYFFELVRPKLHLDSELVLEVQRFQKEQEAVADMDSASRFMIAVMEHSHEHTLGMIDLLIASGIDVNAQDVFGNSALHWAMYINSHQDVIDALKSAGGNMQLKNNAGWTPKRIHETLQTIKSKLRADFSSLQADFSNLKLSIEEIGLANLKLGTYQAAFRKFPEEYQRSIYQRYKKGLKKLANQ